MRRGPGNSSSTYSMIAVDSVSTRSPMQHRRDRPLRIDGEVIGLMLIEIEEVEVVAVERHPFFPSAPAWALPELALGSQ